MCSHCSGDMDEEELYALVAKSAGDKKAATRSLRAHLCDGRGQTCGSYFAAWGDASRRKAEGRLADEL